MREESANLQTFEANVAAVRARRTEYRRMLADALAQRSHLLDSMIIHKEQNDMVRAQVKRKKKKKRNKKKKKRKKKKEKRKKKNMGGLLTMFDSCTSCERFRTTGLARRDGPASVPLPSFWASTS
jgi:hypothetical protein